MSGRDEDCIWCPNCHNWRFTEMLKHSSGYEMIQGQKIWVSRAKCKCTACKHRWTETDPNLNHLKKQ